MRERGGRRPVSRGGRLAGLALPVLALCAEVVAPPPAAGDRVAASGAGPSDPYVTVRGMTISCPGAGRVWGTDAMVDTLAELRTLGVNWVTIHPYAGIGEDGTVGGRYLDRLYRENVRWLTRPIEEAHRLGLKIMIKPHIAYWGSPFSWRGEIAFETEDEWRRFFETYERWIAIVAELSADADAFVVGTELCGTVHREDEWRRIIAAVRRRVDVPLTYAANWDRFEKVPFWDAVDVVGIQSYFPLLDEPGLPAEQRLDRAWTGLVRRLERFSAVTGRKILLAELGYNRSAHAAVRPWDHRQGGEQAEETQRRCLAAALRAVDRSDAIVGAFLWKWFPGDVRRGNFLMSTPAMREVITAQWREAGLAAEAIPPITAAP